MPKRTQANGARILAAAGCLAFTACALTLGVRAAQQSETPEPTFTVTAREVLLDVVVTGPDGQPVTGLKPSDFTITEEGARQTIRKLDEHTPISAADVARLEAAPVLPPNTFSNYTPMVNTNASTVILLDAMDTPMAAQMDLRNQLIAYLKHMRPGPSIAIFQLDTQMHLIHGFSSDPAVLLAAAESKRNWPSLNRPFSAGSGRNGAMGEPQFESRVETLRAGMQMIGRYVAAFPGRKNLIWFTGQVPMTIFGTGFGDPFQDSFSMMPDEMQDLTGVLTMSRVAVYPVDTRGLRVGGAMVNAARGRPPGPNQMMRSEDRLEDNNGNLAAVAQATGGKAFYNTNDFKRVIAEVVDNGSSYYSIAYATTNTKWNGEFRRVKIAVDRPGVRLQYRPGYYAYNREQQGENQLAAIESRTSEALQIDGNLPRSGEPPNVSGALVRPVGGFTGAMALGAVPPTQIVFAASIRPGAETEKLKRDQALPAGNFLRADWKHKPFRNYTILIRADANKIGVTRSANGVRHGRVAFVAVVYTAEGQPVNSLSKIESFDMGRDPYRELLVTGLALKEAIAIPVKGNYFLRLGIHDLVGDQIGAVEIPVDQIRLRVAGEDLQPQ